MRAHEFILIEGQGLRAARPGEVYVDSNGVEFQFTSWNWQFPNTSDLQFKDEDALENGILQATNNKKDRIHWVNSPRGAKSFGYAIFTDKNNQSNQIWIGKFYRQKNPNNTILDKEVSSTVGLTAGGGKSSAIKAQAALQPGNLGLADNRSRNISAISSVVAKHGQGQMLTSAINDAVSNNDIVFVGGAGISSALQDDFCEILAPIAMISDHKEVKGSLANAISDVFASKGVPDISGASIRFPTEQNNPLVDSYIVKNGVELGVSHKGKQGARATITNIWKAKDDASKTPNGKAIIEKFPEAVFILDTCKDQSGLEQPITLGLRYKIIDEIEANALRKAVRDARNPMYQLTGDPANPGKVIRTATQQDLAKVPQDLLRLFNMGGYKGGSYISFLCLARVAHLVRDHINTDSKIDFGEAIRQFLNSSALVQAKSVVSNRGTDARVSSINIVYPPNFKEKAAIESNGYAGTQVKGKFSFSLPTT